VSVDVLSELAIDRPRDRVAAYASDPSNAPEWYVNIKAVGWRTPPPMGVGSQLAVVAHFLGWRLSDTYEIVELVPGELTLRNRGRPSGFSKLVAPFMAVAMRRANRKDLARLKSILEAEPARG
jgi:hypothetical protein